MSLSAGTRLEPYDVLSPLGSGGMGEVYRARDPRLGRDVAVKILPEGVAGDSDRLHRFEQEARAAAVPRTPRSGSSRGSTGRYSATSRPTAQ